jgi:hypothetical protein
MGKKLEKEGKVLEAKALYEANILENFEGSYPYRRLAVLYRKRRLFAEEVRVLEKAVSVFGKLTTSKRSDVQPKLEKFKEGLKKAKAKMSKSK